MPRTCSCESHETEACVAARFHLKNDEDTFAVNRNPL
jgi:hypothetical protein